MASGPKRPEADALIKLVTSDGDIEPTPNSPFEDDAVDAMIIVDDAIGPTPTPDDTVTDA